MNPSTIIRNKNKSLTIKSSKTDTTTKQSKHGISALRKSITKATKSSTSSSTTSGVKNDALSRKSSSSSSSSTKPVITTNDNTTKSSSSSSLLLVTKPPLSLNNTNNKPEKKEETTYNPWAPRNPNYPAIKNYHTIPFRDDRGKFLTFFPSNELWCDFAYRFANVCLVYFCFFFSVWFNLHLVYFEFGLFFSVWFK